MDTVLLGLETFLEIASCKSRFFGLKTYFFISFSQLLRIINSLRESMKQMVCFSPEDTLFVLNRWDTIPTRQQLNFFNSTRERIKSIWSENIDQHIVRLSGGKVKKLYLLYKGKHILPPVLSYNSLYLY